MAENAYDFRQSCLLLAILKLIKSPNQRAFSRIEKSSEA
jgi:hypothetical protein